ncbi:Cytochrome-c3 hydrogenase, gamma subunit [Candidatus Omnitrophus magneticus]|uniref:Dihydroorotate dehydrogenase B (NAD(+)), electron transfer subunit n=1 Tax=Candidatus Omnitrophus magneticus TaxID=1609969 RepID=A0A0F0CML5_9BACT|nr:Cytochrome-c3 hydrogenase, gamma subunit [Candidatus Omnitrophus magneticus]
MCTIKKTDEEVYIFSNKEVASEYFVLEIISDRLRDVSCPGQFMNIRVQDNSYDPLLRVPLGLYKKTSRGISFLYKVIGAGTRLLSLKQKGEKLSILGPLGNGFNLEVNASDMILFIGGGHGIAPLFAAAEALLGKTEKIIFFYGAKTKGAIVFVENLRKIADDVFIATEDGTSGTRGYVTELVEKFLNKNTENKYNIRVFSCGPKPMLKAVSSLLEKHNVGTQVSCDEYMACGIGACRGCAIETIQGIKLVCSDGPVFEAKEILWK